MTAAEHEALTEADPEFVAARAAREAKLLEVEAESRRAQRPLLDDLRAAGYEVGDVWDLVNTAHDYSDAVPVLIRHLSRPHPDGVRGGIARALAIRESKAVWDELVTLYRAEVGQSWAKDGLAVAIAAAADRDVIGDVIDLIRDVGQGPSRIFFIRPLKRSRCPDADQAIEDLASDPDLHKEIAFLRKRWKPRRQDPAPD
jgi:hypothetical protein